MADPSYPLADLFKYAGGYSTTGAPDAETQYFLNKGYISAAGTNDAGQTTYNYLGSNIPAAQLPGGKTAAFGSFWDPKGISGTGQVINPAGVAKDTNYGDITSVYNIKHPEDTDFMSRWFPMIAMSLMTMGMGSAIGAVGGASGMFGPGSLLGKIPSLGQTAGNLLSGAAGGGTTGAGVSGGGTTTPASGAQANAGALLPILLLLSRLKGGG
jgi:hypothetical protein